VPRRRSGRSESAEEDAWRGGPGFWRGPGAAGALLVPELPRWLGFRIDHVLAGGGIAVRDTRVLDLPGSDHRAVLAHLG
jgi:endonuclease/exonuclease/phosphatase (EEP) superfamily protein YafD